MTRLMKHAIEEMEYFRRTIPSVEVTKTEFQEWCNQMDRARIELAKRVRSQPAPKLDLSVGRLKT